MVLVGAAIAAAFVLICCVLAKPDAKKKRRGTKRRKSKRTAKKKIKTRQKDRRKEKGTSGEDEIYNTLEKLSGHKAMLRNCYLPTGRGETTEVDLILFYRSGIYVVESKNYSGWITGSERQRYWTQSFSDRKGGFRKYRFYNPVRQNETHIKAVRWILRDARVKIHSYVVFGDDCQLREIRQYTNGYRVMQKKELLSSIKADTKACRERLSDKMVDKYYRQLYPYTRVTEEQKAEHVHRVREKYRA